MIAGASFTAVTVKVAASSANALPGSVALKVMVSVPFQFTDWGTWREAHPGTQALSLTTGHLKDYGTDPYEGYHRSSMPMFPTRFRRAGHGAKEHAFLVGAPDDPVLVPEVAALEWPGGSMRLEDGTLLTYRQEERWLSAADRAG